MTRVQYPACYATYSPLVGHDSAAADRPFLFPMQDIPSQSLSSCDKEALPQVQKPTMEYRPPSEVTRAQRSSNPLSIQNLLSNDDDGDAKARPQPRLLYPLAESGATFGGVSGHSASFGGPPGSFEYTSSTLGSRIPSSSRLIAGSRYNYGAPATPSQVPMSAQSPRASPASTHHRLWPSRSPYLTRLEEGPLHTQRSPAGTDRSFASSQYSYTSSEPSPRTPAATSTARVSTPRTAAPPPFDYQLIIMQQPVAARACGFGERDRRVVDPPPILKLKVTDKATGAPVQDTQGMLALQCTLLDHEPEPNPEPLTSPSDPTGTRRLMGTTVASPYQAKDEHNTAGTFFVFSDLSCRNPGSYRLHFKLLRLDPTRLIPGAVHASVASIHTEVFTAYTAKDFPGMRASSALLKALRKQGLNVGVKKGSEARRSTSMVKKRKGTGRGNSDEEEEEEEEEEDDENDDDDEESDVPVPAEQAPDTAVAEKTKTKTSSKPSRKRRRKSAI